jgi:excisionase family DNA binding protein
MADTVASPYAQLNTVEETLHRLRISRATGYRLINSGALRSVTIGRRRLVPEQAIADFITSLEATS